MNKFLSHTTRLIALSLLTCFVVPMSTSAQSTLQGSSSGLQQQTEQTTQNSVNTQNQVETLQKNNGSSVLNQTGTQSLGVVSDPKQVTPSTTVGVSTTLKAEPTKTNKRNNALLVLAIISLIITAIGVFILKISSSPKQEPVVAETVIKPEPLKPQKKTRQRRNKKKSRQR